ncbi:MAG TPA: hypothetical protein VN132_00225, partial [Bdellovibrio sp.]|nr:hypothetical protein [Bdellovibrio sp.]
MLYLIFSFLISTSASAASSPVAAPSTNYSVVIDGLKKIAQQNPMTTQWFDLGMSDSGQMISGLKIGNGETADLIVATHHG